VWSQFEHLASTTPDVQAYTKYSSGEVSTVGVGAGLDIKGNRWGGSLKQTGKTKMKSSATYIFNTKYGKFSSKFYRITQYYKWYYMCYADSLDKWLDSGNGFQMRPSGAIYGADERDGWSTPSATHCVPVTKAIVLKTREGSTFTEGADLKAWGFKANLSNMAGRTSGLYVDYRTRPGSKVTKFQLCGTTGKPGLDNNSGALVAKAAK
jgi:hypothetical protein